MNPSPGKRFPFPFPGPALDESQTLPPLLWRSAGLQHTLQLVVIAPLGYRLRQGSKLLYRKPAFLIGTDPHTDIVTLLQGYVRRWDIEVNFREEKILLGVGQAQVRHADSVEAVPALQVASYAMLLLSMARAHGGALPAPKWAATKRHAANPPSRPSIN